MSYLEASDRAGVFVPHAFDEHTVDLGEVRMNYAVAGRAESPALLLIPGQSESWWGYERAMELLADRYQVYAVDLRGQGRSTWTPGRYTIDNMGNDLVRFIDLVIGRPVIVGGNSSGGVLAAWLAAYAKPGQIIATLWEDAPIFSAEVTASTPDAMIHGLGPAMALRPIWLGDQWSIGDWAGMQLAERELPAWTLAAMKGMFPATSGQTQRNGPSQNMKEYDPEWARASVEGTLTGACDHAIMLEHVKVPVLFTHHFHGVHKESGMMIGALSESAARKAQQIVTEAGQEFTYLTFPQAAHAMHRDDPELYVKTLIDWASTR